MDTDFMKAVIQAPHKYPYFDQLSVFNWIYILKDVWRGYIMPNVLNLKIA